MMFLTFGEIMARIAPPGHLRWAQSLPGSVEVTWGGGEANVAASLAMFGNPVKFLTALPRHELSFALERTLRGLGVDTTPILWRADGRLGLYFVEVGANQRGSTVLYDRSHSAISLAKPEEYDFAAALQGVEVLHVTGITPAISEVAFAANLALLQAARRQGCRISCDLNFRKKLWHWRGDDRRSLARECMRQVMPLIDIVIANEGDADDVLGIQARGTNVEEGTIEVDAYSDVARQICEQFDNVSHVAITLRESVSADHNNWGALLYDAQQQQSSLAPLVDGIYQPYAMTDIVDRVGAGDSFAAALLHALHSDRYQTNDEIVAFAVAASCLKHSIKGDFNFVTEEEVRALMKGNTTGRVQR